MHQILNNKNNRNPRQNARGHRNWITLLFSVFSMQKELTAMPDMPAAELPESVVFDISDN
jgi:hypothetical protein